MSDFKVTGSLADLLPCDWQKEFNWGDGTVTGSLADLPRMEGAKQDLEQDVKTT